MIVALDVHYLAAKANAAAVVFDDWGSSEVVARYTAMESPIAEYEPGRFYLRELSPLLAVVRKIEQDVDVYVIDGYCHLSAERAPGLGAYLDEALHHNAAIVGAAKNRYRQTRHAVEVLRGRSRRPLFVTSIGIGYDVAGRHVASMAGRHRIPDMLKAVDLLSRAEAEGRKDCSIGSALDKGRK
jgi:deoxyribonuclease V